MKSIFTIGVALLFGARAFAATEKPNVVIIMSDDMGYSDLGCFGGEIATPNLDTLGMGGLRFARFYSQNMCVVTRATMLTGVYHKTSLRKKAINTRCVTIPELLKRQGYFTAMSGKWHLARYDDQSTWPNQRGFDRYYGILGGAASFYAPANLIRDNRDASAEFERDDYYFTDAISENAVNYINEAKQEQPLFLYVAYTAAHWPLHARESDIAKYHGSYSGGWDKLREARYARMKKLGVIRGNTPLSPRNEDVAAWRDAKNKEWQERRMEVYAAQVEVMDQGIGRIVKALKDAGRFENTLILFMIDNGGCHVEYGKERKGDYLPVKTRSGGPMRPGNLPHIMPGPEDTYQSYGYGWANASNTPYRYFKQHDHEGGIHTPMIAHWPKGIAGKGAVTFQLASVTDVMPTALEIGTGTYPKKFRSNSVYPQDGRSLMPIFQGRQRTEPETLYFTQARGKAVRRGDWKLVAIKGSGKKKSTNWELYNIAEDPAELNDLAKAMPKKVKELAAAYEQWIKMSAARD
jgi:arylsulfatase A-like enzyme